MTATEAGKATQAMLEPVSSFTQVAVQDFAESRFLLDSAVYSDGLALFAVVTEPKSGADDGPK